MEFLFENLSYSQWAGAWADPGGGDPGAACLFQSPAYLSLWLDTMGQARRTQPVFVKVDAGDGRRVMLLALGLERRYGLRILTFLDGGVVDYAGPVRLGPAAGEIDWEGAQALWAALREALPAFDIADLDKMPAEIEGAPNPLRWLAGASSESGWALPLEGAHDDYQRGLNPYAVDSRRKRRRLQDLGPVSFEIAREPLVARRFYDAMVEQKTRRYLETAGKDYFQTPGWSAYFSQVAAREDFGPQAHLSALKVGDRIVATHLGMVSGDTFYWLMPTYEAGPVAKLSPGRLLMEELIGWCYGAGIRSFDFGHGDEDYKAKMGGRQRTLLRLLRGDSLAGRAALKAVRSKASRALQDFYWSKLHRPPKPVNA
jgi:CelD/BcsL family acetyltransferase involved in cellulose biosynthesis